ncbi:50S ribosomal protein L13 [Candidatus Aenigmatarchaeota archaeon]
MSMTINIDAKNVVLGRLATFVAKELIKGESVNIINAEKAIITGNPSKIIDRYMQRRRRGTPHHGPFISKTPEKIVKRTIRGMLPFHSKKGRDYYKKLKVYVSIPDKLDGEKKEIKAKEIRSEFITIGKLSKALGYKV